MQEQWKDIPGYEGIYQVSDLGRVQRIEGRILKTTPNHRKGYPRVNLSKDGKVVGRLVHYLVAQTFLGERPNGWDTNHKNGIKTDNRLENLEYLSKKRHEHYTRHVQNRVPTVFGEENNSAVLTEKAVRQIHADYSTGQYTMREIAERNGVAMTTVSAILNGHNWKHLELPKPPKRDYHLKGIDNPRGKVSPEIAEQIRTLHTAGHSVANLAQQFGLGRTTIRRHLK